MARRVGRAYVGVSGWSYAEWRGTVYPAGLATEDQVPFLAARVNSLEVNATFYRLQDPAMLRAWCDAAPGCVFALKVSRFITHIKRLKDPREAIRKFMAV